MSIKQISVFVENRQGRLAEVTKLLAGAKVDIRALSIADTTDYGILRLIVSDPDLAVETLKTAGLTVRATQVLGVGIEDVPGGFSAAISALSDAGIGVEYAYAFITPAVGKAYVIIRVEDNDAAAAVLKKAGIGVFDQSDIFLK